MKKIPEQQKFETNTRSLKVQCIQIVQKLPWGSPVELPSALNACVPFPYALQFWKTLNLCGLFPNLWRCLLSSARHSYFTDRRCMQRSLQRSQQLFQFRWHKAIRNSSVCERQRYGLLTCSLEEEGDPFWLIGGEWSWQEFLFPKTGMYSCELSSHVTAKCLGRKETGLRCSGLDTFLISFLKQSAASRDIYQYCPSHVMVIYNFI